MVLLNNLFHRLSIPALKEAALDAIQGLCLICFHLLFVEKCLGKDFTWNFSCLEHVIQIPSDPFHFPLRTNSVSSVRVNRSLKSCSRASFVATAHLPLQLKSNVYWILTCFPKLKSPLAKRISSCPLLTSSEFYVRKWLFTDSSGRRDVLHCLILGTVRLRRAGALHLRPLCVRTILSHSDAKLTQFSGSFTRFITCHLCQWQATFSGDNH